jgi:hypothetical protein
MTTLAIVPASGSITATKTVCRVTVAAAPQNTLTGYSGVISNPPTGQAQYPASPAEVYYIDFIKSGTTQGRSYRFTPNAGGDHVFNNYIFPSAGSWTLNLIRVRDSGTEATLAVTVA